MAAATAAPLDQGTGAGRSKWWRRDGSVAALCLLPSLVIFAAFCFLPLWRLVNIGLYRSNDFGTRQHYVGWSQYWDVLTGSEFRDGLVHSLLYVLYTVPAGLVLGTVLAVVANRRLRGIRIFQTIFASTIATSVAVAAVIFFVLINPVVGMFNQLNLLSRPGWALFGVSLSSIWQNLGLCFVIVLAGLQAIPEELLEAATLDGYGSVRRFFKVTLPLLSPILLFLVVVLVVFGMQSYAQIEVLTAGGPVHSTETLVWKIFHSQTPAKAGTGAVMSLGLFVVTAIISALQFALLSRRVHYGND
ncbi:MAG TPA: sugar ABC transporter permease [Acidimicrobiales bacterium]|jgi:sn-glycerol 3-phosphate transport system permease protein|nr:sugar ABC transporter permease [Acidimicrobiales bacterium]